MMSTTDVGVKEIGIEFVQSGQKVCTASDSESRSNLLALGAWWLRTPTLIHKMSMD